VSRKDVHHDVWILSFELRNLAGWREKRQAGKIEYIPRACPSDDRLETAQTIWPT